MKQHAISNDFSYLDILHVDNTMLDCQNNLAGMNTQHGNYGKYIEYSGHMDLDDKDLPFLHSEKKTLINFFFFLCQHRL